MPGIIVFKRRWSVGSDDFVVPAVFLAALHTAWIIVLGCILGIAFKFVHDEDTAAKYDTDCTEGLRNHVLGYLVIMSFCVLLEATIAWVTMRGSILYTEPRRSMQYLLYLRLIVLLIELGWQIYGVVWLIQNYQACKPVAAKQAVLGIIVCNWVIMLSVLLSVWCTFDTAGRSWVKMQQFQQSVRDRERDREKEKQDGIRRRKSGSRRRNWRHRKALRAYEESWDRRCRFLFCCVRRDRHRNSFSEIAKLFTEFFRELDVVPSDVVAGLVLLRVHQKLKRKYVVSEGTNDVYQFLSGVPITPSSKFLRLQDPETLVDYQKVIHYMRYALAAYGWPMYMMMNTGTGFCKIMPHLSCCCCCTCRNKDGPEPELVEDNCCHCHMAALKTLGGLKNSDLVYVTYHVDIGETPFFVAVDHEQKTVVISIRGTLSLQDVLTDLKADAETLPVQPPKEDWLGHKGMVQAAEYIKKKIKDELVLSKAFGRDLERGTQSYELVLVGHSLGAGTAAILAILLHQEFPNLHCYAYSPPGGLLSEAVMEATKPFITSVVVGKDVVPRIGLHQLEALRTDLIDVIKKSYQPKWNIIFKGVLCCGKNDEEPIQMQEMPEVANNMRENRSFLHPRDSQIMLTTHTPLYPPGRIIHVVRNHPKNTGKLCGSAEPVYQAVWVENQDFEEVLISPTMINDHMPDNVMEALEKVVSQGAPAKPNRTLSEGERKALLETDTPSSTNEHVPMSRLEASSHSNTDDPYRSSGQYSLNSDANSLSWDYGAPGHRGTTTRDQRQVKAQSFPPQNRPNTLDLSDEGFDNAFAPLATPETLSETSLDSNSYRGSRNTFPKLTASVTKMDPIIQSPHRSQRSKSEGYCYFVEPPSPVDYADTPWSENKDLVPETLGPLAQSTPMKPVCVVEAQCVSDSSHVDPYKTNTTCDESKDFISQAGNEESQILSNASDFSLLNGVKPLCDQSDQIEQPELSFNLTAEEVKLNEKLRRSNPDDNYKLTYMNETNDTSGYLRHSPDSDCNQVEYSSNLGYYSPAGRGYPHGCYPHTGFAVEVESESELNRLLAETELNRTQEQENISCLPDYTDILEGKSESIKSRHQTPDTNLITGHGDYHQILHNNDVFSL